MNIFLTGLPGSGKTTLGRKIAKHYNFKFLDMDDLIEEKEDRSIPDIFSAEGEDYFRKAEKEALEEVLELDKHVIATGGGAPCFFDNTEKMLANGIVAYLHVSPQEIATRLGRAKTNVTNRPLLAGSRASELQQEIENKLNDRKKYYEQAHVIVEGNQLSFLDVVNAINLYHDSAKDKE